MTIDESGSDKMSFDAKDRARILRTAQKADAVLIGILLGLGKPPPGWSGAFVAFQDAQYRVVRYIRGKPYAAHDTLVLRHPVVAASRTADPHRPGLNPDLFVPGSSLLLFTRKRASVIETFDEDVGVLRADAASIAFVEKLISS